jgi:hypothetical protein
MSEQRAGFYFSCNADGSAHDYTLYVQQTDSRNVVNIGARYKNADRNSIYEIDLDANDLYRFGHMCIDLALQMKEAGASDGE